GEMAAAAQQRDAVRQPALVAAPQLDPGGWPAHPVLVRLVDEDRDPAQRFAPFHHGAVEMRMRDDDAVDAAAGLEGRDAVAGDQAEALPQDVAGVGRQMERPLVDGEGRREPDAEQSGLVLEPEAVPGAERLVRRPGLALPADILPVVF